MNPHNRISRFYPGNRLKRYFAELDQRKSSHIPLEHPGENVTGKTLAIIKTNQRLGQVDLTSSSQQMEFDRYFNSLVISFINFGEHEVLDQEINLDHIQVQNDIKSYVQASKCDVTDAELRAGMDVKQNLIACMSQDLFNSPLALIRDRDFRSFAQKKIISLAELKDFMASLYYSKI